MFVPKLYVRFFSKIFQNGDECTLSFGDHATYSYTGDMNTKKHLLISFA